MSCQICATAHSCQPTLCPTCARNRLYPLRLEHTQVILEKESLGRQIEAAVSHGDTQTQVSTTDKRSSGADPGRSRRWRLQTISSEQASSSQRRNDISRHIEALKGEIMAKKGDITERRELLARRRSDAESAQYQLEEREVASLTGIQNTNKRTEHLWHNLHSKTAEARIFLCREAANLYGLRQKTMRRRDVQPKYELGGATPVEISTSLNNIARLLVIVSHYLSLRLPAEITLPHRNYPIPTIYAPAASYQSREPREKSANSQSSASSPTASSRTETRTQPRPRPLFINTPLPRLAKEDPATYALFLEGTTLLAWDVAWLCRTQGINLNSDSWEEVCNIGKSLWQLLVAPPAQTSTLMRAFAGRDTQTKMKSTKDPPQTTIQRTKSFPMLGHYSHGTAHSFLGASEGSEFIRTWKLPTPTRIVDKLKASLLGEMASAEWELLEEKEWDDEAAGAHQPSGLQEPTISTPSSSQPQNNVTSGSGTDDRRPRGTSGWTKLNSR